MGIYINHKKILRITKRYNLLSKVRRKKKKCVSGAEPVVAPNLLELKFEASAPNEKWFTDVTYLMFGERTLYFSTIAIEHTYWRKTLPSASVSDNGLMLSPS